MRFCDPLSGKIYIEGKDYCSMKPEELLNLLEGTE